MAYVSKAEELMHVLPSEYEVWKTFLSRTMFTLSELVSHPLFARFPAIDPDLLKYATVRWMMVNFCSFQVVSRLFVCARVRSLSRCCL
jgi:hypothetical protein